MAKKTAKLRGMSPEALAKEEHGLREEIWKLRIQLTTGQLQDPQKVRRTKQDLARLLTVRRESELQAARTSGS
jgi:large subunit ribosomal protein L29